MFGRRRFRCARHGRQEDRGAACIAILHAAHLHAHFCCTRSCCLLRTRTPSPRWLCSCSSHLDQKRTDEEEEEKDRRSASLGGITNMSDSSWNSDRLQYVPTEGGMLCIPNGLSVVRIGRCLDCCHCDMTLPCTQPPPHTHTFTFTHTHTLWTQRADAYTHCPSPCAALTHAVPWAAPHHLPP